MVIVVIADIVMNIVVVLCAIQCPGIVFILSKYSEMQAHDFKMCFFALTLGLSSF